MIRVNSQRPFFLILPSVETKASTTLRSIDGDAEAQDQDGSGIRTAELRRLDQALDDGGNTGPV